MKSSERILVVITVVAAALFGTVRFGLLDKLNFDFSLLGVSDARIAQASNTAAEIEAYLAKEARVVEEYDEKVRAYLPEPNPNKNPLDAFAVDTEGLPRKISLAIGATQVAPPKREPVPGIADYEFATVELTYQKSQSQRVPWKSTVGLLKGYDAYGFLIKNLQLNAVLDQDEFTVKVTLARPIRVDAAPKKADKNAPPRPDRKAAGATRQSAGVSSKTPTPKAAK